jgi:Zn-dependent protease with chaperone function
VAGLEARWSHAVGALLLILALVGAAYVWGLPYVAELAAARMPQRVVALMDEQFMQTVDGRLLHPSKLSAARQQALLGRVRALRWPPDAQPPTRILFRSSPEIGPNAFALPGGTVVVLDQLVQLAHNDDEIIGVLAHEIGHVSERHALRQMLQASVVGLAMAWYVGDVSSVLAAAPSALLETRYSRDFERRADAFAARTLKLNGIPPSRLADMLQSLEQAYAGRKQKVQDNGHAHWMDYLSTHPATDERIRALQEQGR